MLRSRFDSVPSAFRKRLVPYSKEMARIEHLVISICHIHLSFTLVEYSHDICT